MHLSPVESMEFSSGLSRLEAQARLEASLDTGPPPRIGGWVSEFKAILVVRRVFGRSGYVFDGRWADGPDGARLVGEFRPARYSWLFYALAVWGFTLTDLAVPAPATNDLYAWTPVLLQRFAWLAVFVGLLAIGARLTWSTVAKADLQAICEHMEATFGREVVRARA